MSYEGQVAIGQLVRAAAKAAEHDDSDADLERLNNILVGEAFVSALADAGCMITRIPTRRSSAPSFDPAWDKSPEEIARIQALPNVSRLGTNRVRSEAAKTAVTASEKTGRPVDPRVAEKAKEA